MNFYVCSRENAKRMSYKICEPTLIISITDPNKMPNNFAKNPNIKSICRVMFDDIDKNEEKEGYLIAMTEKDAEKIKSCVEKHKDKVDCIIVHCEAGISRSSGVMAAIQKYLIGSDEAIFNNAKYCPNMHCYKMMLEQFFGKII